MPVAITNVGYLIGRGVLKRPSGDDAVEVCKECLYHEFVFRIGPLDSEKCVVRCESPVTIHVMLRYRCYVTDTG